jgi:transposase-like protein
MQQARREIKRMDYWGEGWEYVREASRGALRHVLNELMQERIHSHLEEVARKGACDRRNGSFRRQLLTAIGEIELQIPRTRTMSAVGVVKAFARREPDVDRVILLGFILGLSTRKVSEALLPFLGVSVSPSTVSRIARALDEEVEAFHKRPLRDRYKALILDGVVMSTRTGAGADRRPVLVALGILPDGKKEIIDFFLGPAESEAAWVEFLTSLQERGLHGKHLEIVVADGGGGLRAALPIVYPGMRIQRCWAHKTRNVLDKVKKADWERVKKGLHRISHAQNLVAARSTARRFANRWEDKYPKAVKCLRSDLEELLLFFRFKDPVWRQATRTTNAIERRFVEVRRRTRPMGVLADRTSVSRILYAVFARENIKERSFIPFPLTQNS